MSNLRNAHVTLSILGVKGHHTGYNQKEKKATCTCFTSESIDFEQKGKGHAFAHNSRFVTSDRGGFR